MFFGGMHFPMGHVLTTRTIFYHLAVFTISPSVFRPAMFSPRQTKCGVRTQRDEFSLLAEVVNTLFTIK